MTAPTHNYKLPNSSPQVILAPFHLTQANSHHQAHSYIQVYDTRRQYELETLVATFTIYPLACIHKWFKVAGDIHTAHLPVHK